MFSVTRVLKKLGFRTSKPKGVFVDIEELYQNSLYHSADVRPWAVDDTGKFIGLEYRYLFARAYLDNPSVFDPEKSEYIQFIREYEARGFRPPYDGNRSYAIADAEAVGKRYMVMIDSIVKNLPILNSLSLENVATVQFQFVDLAKWLEREYPRKVYYFKTSKKLVQPESARASRSVPILHTLGGSFPTAVNINSHLVIKNGSHRLAVYKALKDLGLYKNPSGVFVYVVD